MNPPEESFIFLLFQALYALKFVSDPDGHFAFLPVAPEAVRHETQRAIEYFNPYALEILRRQRQKGGVFAKLPDLTSAGDGAAVFVELHCNSEATGATWS